MPILSHLSSFSPLLLLMLGAPIRHTYIEFHNRDRRELRVHLVLLEGATPRVSLILYMYVPPFSADPP